MKEHRPRETGGEQASQDDGSARAAPKGDGNAARADALRTSPPKGPTGPEGSYTVVEGDNLSDIAEKLYGTEAHWKRIYELNKEEIGEDPDLIKPGTKLRLPTDYNKEEAPAPDGGEGEEGGECVPPDFPHVVYESGLPDEENDAFLEFGRMDVEEALKGWKEPYDKDWVSVHTYTPGDTAVVIAWQGDWGPLPETGDFQASTNPLQARLAAKAAEGSDGWAEMSADSRDKVGALLGGETNKLSAKARSDFQPLYADPGWAGQDKAAQAAVMEGLMTSETARPGVVSGMESEVQADYELKGPTVVKGYAFRGANADADQWNVHFAEVVIPVFAPHNPDDSKGHFHSIQQAAVALASLPEVSRKQVTKVVLNANRNPEDPHWRVEYNDPDFDSYMTAGVAGEIHVYPTDNPMSQDYMSETMVHETGHTWSKKMWGEDSAGDKWKPWRDAMASDKISVSNYATNDPDEDVAETIQVFMGTKGEPQHEEYRAMVPQRFEILDKHF